MVIGFARDYYSRIRFGMLLWLRDVFGRKLSGTSEPNVGTKHVSDWHNTHHSYSTVEVGSALARCSNGLIACLRDKKSIQLQTRCAPKATAVPMVHFMVGHGSFHINLGSCNCQLSHIEIVGCRSWHSRLVLIFCWSNLE